MRMVLYYMRINICLTSEHACFHVKLQLCTMGDSENSRTARIIGCDRLWG
ncbi:hypothetical protein IX307_000171 [Bacteroides pyogenes]|nr:hypothetical protein [Bacteroides pyogenes]MBR8724975.1 hypothetical protein [Bacteroides pyogenes]MBR8738549.1 hypothetical protein [Bacteroides pyogenes]MBR8754221.1 hypothetical protein [Bacteroides pyogenes]MBR8785872.1 hypothetical protein [Bacteroides pyogenes]